MCTTTTNAVEALICPPPIGASGTEWGEVRHIASGVWDVGLTYIPIEDTAVSWCGFSSQIPYLISGLKLWGQHLILNPNTRLLCWLGKIGPRNWRSSCSQEAFLVYRWVQDEVGDQGWSLWAICEKKAWLFSRKICYSLSGRDIC